MDRLVHPSEFRTLICRLNSCFLFLWQDEEIKKYVKQILEGANLEEITMKTVCKQVYSHYPDFDLAHKKDFIKATVKSVNIHPLV